MIHIIIVYYYSPYLINYGCYLCNVDFNFWKLLDGFTSMMVLFFSV
jgi:hypothetical protein